jgi:hypothetical protein
VSELEKLVASLKEEISTLKIDAAKLGVHDKWQKVLLAVMTLLAFGAKSSEIRDAILRIFP